jgi:hypothetical protein
MLIGKRLGSDMHIIVNEAHLRQRSWCFGHSESVVYAPLVRFGAGGRLIGYRHANENSWAILNGRVALLDEAGLPSTIFDRSSIGLDGRMRLEGRHRDGAIIHFLREVDFGEGPAPYAPHIRLIQRQPVGRRRNLVVLRANEESLHTSWVRDIQDQDRSWDLCISYYGKPETFPPEDFSEFACLQHRQRKFAALKSLMHKGSILWHYDYIMFPDDDLQMKWSDLNILFNICSEYELQLAQPSLDPDSVINYDNSKQKPEFLLRFVTMVELMAPIFSNQALRSCIHTFDLNESSYGIDYAWTKMIDGPLTKIAVIDRVSVLHTRPTGNNYDLKAAIDEGYETSDKFGFLDQYSMRELGGILAHKVVDPEEIKQDEELTLAKFSYCASSNKLSANGVE